MSELYSTNRKNPSRKKCEEIIVHILKRELEEYGFNRHFKHAADFLGYFESLYPASAGLTKQVQRAINSLNLPRDENGYLMINKTAEEYQAELELSHLLENCSFKKLDECQPVLLKTDAWLTRHIMHLMESTPVFRNLYETLMETNNGILIFTETADELCSLLSDYLHTNDGE